MRNIFLMLLLANCCSLIAQNKPFIVTKENLGKPRSFAKGSIIHVQDDSVTVYDAEHHRESLKAFNEILKNFTGIRQQYDSCMLYSSESSRKLSAVTLSLAASVNSAMDSAGVVLAATKQNLVQATKSLEAANTNLKNIEELLKQERKSRHIRALAWGIGGFGTGIIASSVVMLFFNRR